MAVPNPKPDPETLKLAYETATARLQEQDGTLANIRNRATGLLAAATVGTSFATSVGLLSTTTGAANLLPGWAPWALSGLVVAIGVAVFVALWPIRAWSFGVEPELIMKNADKSPTYVHKNALPGLIQGVKDNTRSLEIRFNAYRAGVGLVTAELVVLCLAVIN